MIFPRFLCKTGTCIPWPCRIFQCPPVFGVINHSHFRTAVLRTVHVLQSAPGLRRPFATSRNTRVSSIRHNGLSPLHETFRKLHGSGASGNTGRCLIRAPRPAMDAACSMPGFFSLLTGLPVCCGRTALHQIKRLFLNAPHNVMLHHLYPCCCYRSPPLYARSDNCPRIQSQSHVGKLVSSSVR